MDGVTVRVDASVGISLFPQHGAEVATLLRHADIAMYQRQGCPVRDPLFESETDGEHGDRTDSGRWKNCARRNLCPHAGCSLPTEGRHSDPGGHTVSRPWSAGNHPRSADLLLPDAFLQLAEDAGLMRDLTLAVLEQSLDQVARWRASGLAAVAWPSTSLRPRSSTSSYRRWSGAHSSTAIFPPDCSSSKSPKTSSWAIASVPARFSPSCADWVFGSPSTTSAPVTHRLPTCVNFPSTS